MGTHDQSELRKRQRQAIENDFNNEEIMKTRAAKLLNDIASGKVQKRDLPNAFHQIMLESGVPLDDRTFVGANSNISFEELSSKQENESLKGTFPARSIYSGRNHVEGSEAQSEHYKKVDEMLAPRGNNARAPDISVNFKSAGLNS